MPLQKMVEHFIQFVTIESGEKKERAFQILHTNQYTHDGMLITLAPCSDTEQVESVQRDRI